MSALQVVSLDQIAVVALNRSAKQGVKPPLATGSRWTSSPPSRAAPQPSVIDGAGWKPETE